MKPPGARSALVKIDVDREQRPPGHWRSRACRCIHHDGGWPLLGAGRWEQWFQGAIPRARSPSHRKLAALTGDGGLAEAVGGCRKMLAEGGRRSRRALGSFAGILGEDPRTLPASMAGPGPAAHLALGEARTRAEGILNNPPRRRLQRPIRSWRPCFAKIALARGSAEKGRARCADPEGRVDGRPRAIIRARLRTMRWRSMPPGRCRRRWTKMLELFRPRLVEWNDGAAKWQLFTNLRGVEAARSHRAGRAAAGSASMIFA